MLDSPRRGRGFAVLALLAIATASGVTSRPEAALAHDGQTVVNASTVTGFPARYVGVRAVVSHSDGSATAHGVYTDGNGQAVVPAGVGDHVRVEISGQNVHRDTGTFAADDCHLNARVNATEGSETLWVTMPQVVFELAEPELSGEERRFIDLVNAERARVGVASVQVGERLAYGADAQAAHRARVGVAGHTGANCEHPNARVAEMGANAGSRDIQEIVTVGGPSTAEAAFQRFINSPGHARIIREGNPYIGVAHAEDAWVAVFAASNAADGSAPNLPRRKAGNDDTAESGPVKIDRIGRTYAGRLLRLEGEATPGATIRITYRPRSRKADGETITHITTADDHGFWEAPGVRARHDLRAYATGDGHTARRTIRVYANPRVRTRRSGNRITISGYIRPKMSRRRIHITVHRDGHRERVSARTRRGGRFKVTIRIRGNGRARASIKVSGTRGIYHTRTQRFRVQ